MPARGPVGEGCLSAGEYYKLSTIRANRWIGCRFGCPRSIDSRVPKMLFAVSEPTFLWAFRSVSISAL